MQFFSQIDFISTSSNLHFICWMGGSWLIDIISSKSTSLDVFPNDIACFMHSYSDSWGKCLFFERSVYSLIYIRAIGFCTAYCWNIIFNLFTSQLFSLLFTYCSLDWHNSYLTLKFESSLQNAKFGKVRSISALPSPQEYFNERPALHSSVLKGLQKLQSTATPALFYAEKQSQRRFVLVFFHYKYRLHPIITGQEPKRSIYLPTCRIAFLPFAIRPWSISNPGQNRTCSVQSTQSALKAITLTFLCLKASETLLCFWECFMLNMHTHTPEEYTLL